MPPFSLLLYLAFSSRYIYKESEKTKMYPPTATKRTREKLVEQGGFLSFLKMTMGGVITIDEQRKIRQGK